MAEGGHGWTKYNCGKNGKRVWGNSYGIVDGGGGVLNPMYGKVQVTNDITILISLRKTPERKKQRMESLTPKRRQQPTY